MEPERIVARTQEQATASWINYLNGVRMESVAEGLRNQQNNWYEASRVLNDTITTIDKEIIQNRRGGLDGMHGFIAEVSECGIGNARELVEGRMPIYEWINDNGPADLLKAGIPIQEKFVSQGNHLSLQAVSNHLEKYPFFLKEGGKYYIPRDHYEKIQYLLSIPKETANKMPTSTGEFSLKQWKEVHEFFEKGNIKLDDIEPSDLKYGEVQAKEIGKTLDARRQELKARSQERENAIRDSGKPTLKQGTTATVASAAIEGGLAFVLAIQKKRKAGKKLSEFNQQDWEEILKETGVGTIKGGIRGASIYFFTNFAKTPAAVVSAMCTASFGMAEQVHLYRTGKCSEDQFVKNSELICLETTVSAFSSVIGQIAIPVPVLGAVIGSLAGTTMYHIGINALERKERALIEGYLTEIRELELRLEEKYRLFVENLNAGLEKYYVLLDKAFAPDYEQAFQGSIALARHFGVPEKELLKNVSEIDRYFLA